MRINVNPVNMESFNVPKNEFVSIVGVKFNVVCKKCGYQYGVYLDLQGNPPDGWDFCFRCQNKITT